jgi:DNA-binding CsgD family transcriptional regulator
MDQGDRTLRWGYDPIDHGSRSRPARKLVAFCWRDGRFACPRLGSRELQALARLEEAKAYKQIAIALSISESLVHKLVHRVFLQLGAHKRTEALAHWWACCACPNAHLFAACRPVRNPELQRGGRKTTGGRGWTRIPERKRTAAGSRPGDLGGGGTFWYPGQT